jgi:hypothetical protein
MSETKSDRAPHSRHEYQPSPPLSLSLSPSLFLGGGRMRHAAAVRALLREAGGGRSVGWTDRRTGSEGVASEMHFVD